MKMKRAVGVLTVAATLFGFVSVASADMGGGSPDYLPYYMVDEPREGLAAYCTEEGPCGFIDTAGQIIIQAKYDNVKGFSEGLAKVVMNGKAGYINRTGEVVVPPKYDDAADFFKDGYAQVTIDGKWGFIDKTGNEIIPIAYDDTNTFYEGLSAVETSGKYGFMDKQGNFVIKPQYEMVHNVSEGVAPVRTDGKWKFINITGKDITKPVYDDASAFSNGLAPVKRQGKWGYIDKNGVEVIPPTYDTALRFKEGLAGVQLNKKFGFIDITGKMVIQPRFSNVIYGFQEGLAIVLDNSEGRIYIDHEGARALPYYGGTPFINGLAQTADGGAFSAFFIHNPLYNVQATPTDASVQINGVYTAFQAYQINGNNYFKLRDIASALTKSNKKFDVSWDNDKNAIKLSTNSAYTPVGGEMEQASTNGQINAVLTSSKTYKDNSEVFPTAYQIDGSNYFKLRDIASILNFGVKWDEAANMISVDTQSNYVSDK